ncbi:MAG: hypothetical protein A3J93_05240 [Candidatus Magasanikbacteria bacterium RIFOXYC2_FULL_42_28]|uniref:Uncharacterized protein n=1 Tax=Candidatus Magasanikbacteria bacterium RIFOXYC2_FULL_42_28 TaxID=1798704 RepID=A0A1F6NV39_9BACT|nr:MAG: hypothetical protein A3J93_05240 [Candidatus Magasanikbacteria bacterium RIFOXYC2_FULL_42_28]
MFQKQLAKFFEFGSYILLLLSVLLVPMAIDNQLVNSYIIPKQYVLGGLVLLAALFWAARAVVTKKVSYIQSFADKPLILFLLVALLTAIFSANRSSSFLGVADYYILSFASFVVSVLFYFLIVNHFTTAKRWRLGVDLTVLVGGVSATLFLLRTVFNFDVLSKLGISAWNLIDPTNTAFGIWLVAIFMLSAGQLIKKNCPVGRSLFNFFVALLAVACLLTLGFDVLWWVLLIGLALLLLLGVTFLREARLGWLTVLFALLVTDIIFITFNSPKVLQTSVPVEVALGARPSWDVTSATLGGGVKSFLLGSGLGTFGVDFSRYRSVDFNNDPVAWSLRFNQPFNTLLAFLSEGGLLLALAFVFVVVFFLGHILYVWLGQRAEVMFGGLSGDLGWKSGDLRFEIFLVSLVWVLLTICTGFAFFGQSLWWLWWFLLGLSASGLGFIYSKAHNLREWEIEDAPQYSLSFSFILVVLSAGIVMSGVIGARMYMAERAYAVAVRADDLDTVEINLKKAISLRDNYSVYNFYMARLFLSRAVEASKNSNPDPAVISALMSNAVNTARRATDIAPASVGLWENLATMYENAAVIVPEARDWAVKSWMKCTELEPTNPVLWLRLGNNYLASGNNEDAKKSFEEAIKLKSDYVVASISLSQIYETEQNFEKAVEIYEKIMTIAGNNAEVAYNYGRLLYNRNAKGDRDGAEQIWLKVIEAQPNFSNVLYSLGMLYETRGDKYKALDYYYQVKELNPDNKDITAKIKSLVGVPVAEVNKK